jgi:MFS family permease
VRFVVRHPVLVRLVTLLGILNFFYFAAEAVLVLYTLESLHAGKAAYTAMFLAAAAGTVATQWLVTPLQERIGAARTITISFWLWTAGLLAAALTHSWVVAAGGFFLLGAGDGLWRVLTVTLRQRLTPNRLLGRVNAAYRTVAQGVIPIGAAFGGVTARLWGVRSPFVIATAVFVGISLAGPFLLRPVARLSTS